MLSLLSGLPGADDFRAIARRVDTARHHGVPAGCILELDLTTVPAETAHFDPVAIVSSLAGGRRPLLLRETVAAIHRAAE
ncbi:MAG TPA: signal peptide peptidase SppA, partial [Mycolicibacterium fallax]|nr:signal peptide peptidase SppA [Mycolicibacterium fallax]